ncbi:MAG TPA: permease prefix domain 1-containing protein [Phycisphaerales bacterium]|nr:permease prefix domain 1-containing protein [Phycisphaerales bacterium]
MLNALLARLSRIDERPVEQIDRDIDDELTAHLLELEHDLILKGLSPAAARETALSRFGNPDNHRRRCRDVALQERRMKTYAQMIVTVACGLLLGAVTTSVWFSQQSANAALLNMSTRMDEMSRALSSRVPAPVVADPTALGLGSVYITGAPVSRPGQYSLPANGLSLRRLLAAAGVNTPYVASIDVRRAGAGGAVERLSGRDLGDGAGPDIELRADDLVTVHEAQR